MRPHGDIENGLTWDDGHIPYNQLSSVLNEAVAGFAHLYAYGDSKWTFISQLLGRPVHNLDDFHSPSPRYFEHKISCSKPRHRNPSFRCASIHAHSLHECLIYHPRKCLILPALMTRLIILPALFQLCKAAQIYYLHSFRVAMASRRRPLAPTQPLDEQLTRRAPELRPCTYVEIVSPALDPNRVLLRRVFFLNDDK